MNETRKQIIELIKPFMDKTLNEGCLIKSKRLSLYPENEAEIGEVLIVGRFHKQWDINIKRFKVMNGYSEELEIFNFEDIIDYNIIGHYDITAVWGYINSINLGGVGLYYFDSVAISKDYYILTPTGDNDYLRIPNKPLHLYTGQEEKDLLDLLLKLK